MSLMRKNQLPLNLITRFATLGGNNRSQVFALTFNESFTSLEEFYPTPLKKLSVSAIAWDLIVYGDNTASQMNFISLNFD